MNGDNYYSVKPSYCEIQSLKIISKTFNADSNNYYEFKNNIIEKDTTFFTSFDLYFYKEYQGYINYEKDIIYFLIPPDCLTETGKEKYSIPNDSNDEFLLLPTKTYQSNFEIQQVDSSIVEDNNSNNILIDNELNEDLDEEDGASEELTSVEEVPSDELPIEPPEVSESAEPVYLNETQQTVIGFNSRSIKQFCQLSLYPRKIKLLNNNGIIDNSIDSGSIIYKQLSLIAGEDLINSDEKIVPLIPCVILPEGTWNPNNSLRNEVPLNLLVFSDLRKKGIRPSAQGSIPSIIDTNSATIIDVSSQQQQILPARLTLDDNNQTGVNNNDNSTFVFLKLSDNQNDIVIENKIFSLTEDNIMSIWDPKEFSVIYDPNNNIDIYNYTTGDKVLEEAAFIDNNLYYYEIVNESQNLIWHSNLFEYHAANNSCIGSCIRYYITKVLSTKKYMAVESVSSPYIMLRLKLKAYSIDKISIYMGTTLASVSDIDENSQPIYSLEESLQQTVKTITIPNKDMENVLKNDNAVFFAIQSFGKNPEGEYIKRVNDITTVIQCPKKQEFIPPLDIEKNGIGIGKLATGTSTNPKFEIGSAYTTHFYGKVEIFPVGAIYLSTTNVNPGTYFYGTWQSWGAGRIPIGVQTSNTNFNASEKTGGALTHKLTVSEMPKHRHEPSNVNTAGSDTSYKRNFTTNLHMSSDSVARIKVATSSSSTARSALAATDADDIAGVQYTTYQGGSTAFSILPPYITCYMWKRIA